MLELPVPDKRNNHRLIIMACTVGESSVPVLKALRFIYDVENEVPVLVQLGYLKVSRVVDGETHYVATGIGRHWEATSRDQDNAEYNRAMDEAFANASPVDFFMLFVAQYKDCQSYPPTSQQLENAASIVESVKALSRGSGFFKALATVSIRIMEFRAALRGTPEFNQLDFERSVRYALLAASQTSRARAIENPLVGMAAFQKEIKEAWHICTAMKMIVERGRERYALAPAALLMLPAAPVEFSTLPKPLLPIESQILALLNGKAMTAKELKRQIMLVHNVKVADGTLRDALGRLKLWKKIANSPGLGYYKPDFPPGASS